jgi:O-antigen ligase
MRNLASPATGLRNEPPNDLRNHQRNELKSGRRRPAGQSAGTLGHPATDTGLRLAGLLPWIFPVLLAVPALDVLFSGRDLADSLVALEAVESVSRSALVDWLQRGASLLLLVASLEQIVHHALRRLPVCLPLVAAFGLYWVGSVALPAAFGAHPTFSHELLYAPATGLACCLATPQEQDRIVQLARDALALLLLAGLALLAWRPTLVADVGYLAGLLPGLPRLAGLTPHAVTQGLLAQVFLLLLWVRPYRRPLADYAAWALGLTVLVMAQSKTAWLAFALCALALLVVRHGPALRQRLNDPSRAGALVAACAALCLAIAVGAAALLSGALDERAADFMASEQGAQLLSLTGRDRIWAAAIEEWRQNPVFGYGLSLWDAAYRHAIGLPHATHAHNQWLDDAARAGSVGVAALVIYAAVLLTLCLRHARASGGLALALGLTLALRAVGEVPLSLVGYGTELFVHLLLVATLAAAAFPGEIGTRGAHATQAGPRGSGA